MNTIKFTIVACMLFFSASAQQTFYEQLKANGNDAIYTTFYRYNATSEVYTPGKQGDDLHIKLIEIGGIPVGFEAYKVKDGQYAFGFHEINNYGRSDHFPITKMIKHKYDREAYAMIDGSLYQFNVAKDGKLNPQQLWEVYVLQQKEVPVTQEKKPKKKKKGLFSRFKNLGKGSNSNNAAFNYLKSLDIKTHVCNYEAQMTAMQQSYTLTSKDKSAIAKIEKFRKEGKEYVKRYNDSIYNSPKEVENRRKWAKINGRTSLTVKNNTTSTIWISSSKSNFSNTKINAGGTGNADCRSDLYYFFSDQKGVKGYKFYTANNACGSSVTIN
ncbi:MAG: hypothetical protein AAF617_08440 [Bacteroidota bacterium]